MYSLSMCETTLADRLPRPRLVDHSRTHLARHGCRVVRRLAVHDEDAPDTDVVQSADDVADGPRLVPRRHERADVLVVGHLVWFVAGSAKAYSVRTRTVVFYREVTNPAV